MFLKPSVGQTKHSCRPDVASSADLQPVVHSDPSCDSCASGGPETAEHCWSEGVVQTGAQVTHRLMAQDRKTPPPPMC